MRNRLVLFSLKRKQNLLIEFVIPRTNTNKLSLRINQSHHVHFSTVHRDENKNAHATFGTFLHH